MWPRRLDWQTGAEVANFLLCGVTVHMQEADCAAAEPDLAGLTLKRG